MRFSIDAVCRRLRRGVAADRRRRPVARVALAWLLIAMITGALVPSAHAEDGRATGLFWFESDCENIVVKAGWGQIALPNFGAGERRATSYAVDAWNRKRLFVTNGFEVFRSMDGGCSWEKVYALPAQPSSSSEYSQLDARIDQVVIPQGSTADKIAYIVIDQYRPPNDVARGSRTRVLRTENNGSRWVDASGELPEVLPPHGAPEQLLPSPSFPKVLYMLMESPDVQYTATSPDGGETWEPAGPICLAPVLPQQVDTPLDSVENVPGAGCVDPEEKSSNAPKPSDTTGIAIDPFQPNDLWFYGPRGLERSLNSGRNPHPIEEVKEPIAAVDIFRVAGQDARIVAAAAKSPTLYISDDGGRKWHEQGAPGFVQSIAPGRHSQEFLMASDAGVFMFLNGSIVPIGPSDRRPIYDIRSARTLGGTGGLCVFGSGGTRLDVACASAPEKPPPPKRHLDPIVPPTLGGTKAASFIPEGYETTLDRGESEVVPYTLELFKSPTPLDVYFLIDISGSMQNTIDGVAHGLQSIIERLAAEKINTNFGVGVYRSYSDAPAYRRVLDLQPPGEPLRQALERMIANGGGDETQLAALYQTATGEGQDSPTDAIGALRAHIDPNQQANFRSEALKVVIHATDEKFSTLPPHPSYTQVIDALNQKGIEQVGLAIQDPGTGGSADDPDALATPRSGLLKVAEGTHTVAAGHVDCDGNGKPDIEPEEALVCDIDPDHAYKAALMSGAIVQLLDSVEDIGEVLVTVDAPPGVVPNMESKLFTGVDFKHPPDLNFDVMFTCPAGTDRRVFPVTFNAIARDFLIAETTATVRCRVNEPPPPPPRPPQKDPQPAPLDPVEPEAALPSFFPIPAFIPPIIRPPEVSPNPGPNAQSQPQAQSQGQMQSAMAKQKQEQVQLALAYSKSVKAELAAERAGDDLNMSKYRSTTSRREQEMPPGLILMMSASAMSLAFGLAARRYRSEPQAARRDRRFR